MLLSTLIIRFGRLREKAAETIKQIYKIVNNFIAKIKTFQNAFHNID